MSTYGTTNLIPTMTSNTAPSGVVSASTEYNAQYMAWRAFDKLDNVYYWLTATGTLTGWISYQFTSSKIVGIYTILPPNVASDLKAVPKNWTFEGSNDNGLTWTVLDTQANITGWTQTVKKTFVIAQPRSFLMYRVNITLNSGSTSYAGISELELFEYIPTTKVLIFNDGSYKKYGGGLWQTVTTSFPTEANYINEGMDDISIIPESAWQQLTGNVELCYYTDDANKTEVSFGIETEPFTLAEEWEDQIIKVIEYTDNPSQTESTVTIETDPFTLSDEWKDQTVEVLYYTDDPAASNQQLNVSMNVTGRRNLIKNIANPTILAYNTNASAVVDASISGIPNDKYYKYKVSIDDTTTPNNPDDTILDWTDWNITNTETSVTIPSGYVNKLNPYNVKVEVQQLDNKVISGSGQILLFNQSPIFIMGAISYNTLSATLDDPDSDTIQYQVLLNGKIIAPIDGGWSPPQTVPLPIVVKFDTKDIIIGGNNTCIINVKDQFGVMASLNLTFIGDYNGIMFSDTTGVYYSTDSGVVLKQLDFGMLVAGFNSDIATVRIINKNYFPIKNLELSFDKSNITQFTDVKMSKFNGDSFLDSDALIFDNILNSGEYLEFYVRIKTQMLANGGSLFKINTKADVSV